MARRDDSHQGKTDTAITGQMVSCPRCGGATGVPVPSGSTIVDREDAADGSSTTKCPSCDERFEVSYRVGSDD